VAWDLLAVPGTGRHLCSSDRAHKAGVPGVVVLLVWRPLRALELAHCWADMLRVVLAMADVPDASCMYLRQLEVPGTDTKFIEKHRGVLAELLDLMLPPSRVDLSAVGFESRYGFRRKPRYVRFRAAARGADRIRDRERDHLPGVSPARRRDGDRGKRLRGART
jgi:hypothetical protein